MQEVSRVIPQSEFKDNPLLSRLLELHDIPKKIHIKGELPKVTIDEYGRATPRILTIVGSRKYTDYGRQVLQKLLRECKNHPIVILSGLALGIDGLAHKEALTNGLTTIAVPGSGLGPRSIYPSSHRGLAQEIREHNGVLLSELDDDARAALWTFPMRNRIMAALSDAVLIIEAEEKSGTLITVRQALELGRDIGAVPGNIFSPTAQGPLTLIKDGAYSVTSASDLCDLLHLSYAANEEVSLTLTPHESLILSLLREPLQKDDLFAQSGLSFPDFLTTLSSLEITGHIEETFGEVKKVV
jgi:DNA processing protein